MSPIRTPDQHPVLVVGAGPVGLTAAAELARRGIPVRCVDRAAGPSSLTKALAVWPRTLEVLSRLGGHTAIGEHGMPMEGMRYYSDGRTVARIAFDRRTRPVVLPQPDVEAIVAAAFQAAGGTIEWGTELLDLELSDAGAKVRLRLPSGTEELEEFSYVIGCDGSGSRVRELLGIEFGGSTYPMSFVLADVLLDGGPQHDVGHYFCSSRGILVVSGLPSGRYRVFTSAPPDLKDKPVTLEVVQRLVDERGPGGLTLRDPTWVSSFPVHARHAERTRVGRVLIAGDAAHIHSPAGGQGLNTGVLDSHNLAWKVALVWSGVAAGSLLDTYEQERSEVAASVVRQAHLQTRAWLLRKRHQVFLRDPALRLASLVRLARLSYLPRLAGLRTVYRGGLRPGAAQGRGFTDGALAPDRVVWDEQLSRRLPLRDVLSDLRFTLLLSADANTPAIRGLTAWIAARCPELVAVRTLDADGVLRDGLPEQERSGVRRASAPPTFAVLVRPDQHVALSRRPADADDLVDYLAGLLGSETSPVLSPARMS